MEFTQEYLEAVKRSEEERIRQKHAKKRQQLMEEIALLYADSDDRFAFIAGYTSGARLTERHGKSLDWNRMFHMSS